MLVGNKYSKCVIRGTLISLGDHSKPLLTAQIDSSLLRDIGETAHKKSQAQQTEEKLSRLRDELNPLLMDKAKAQLIRCRRTFCEFGNKLSRMLANALRDRGT